ncbi:MAG: transglutaminase domain-containing protein, partial [Planctomycetota bacterium]
DWASAVLPGDPPEHPFLQYGRAEDWSVVTSVSLYTCTLENVSPSIPLPTTETTGFRDAVLWLPFATATAGSVPLRRDFGHDLRIDGWMERAEAVVVAFDQSGAQYAELAMGREDSQNLTARVETLRRSFALRYLEEDALGVPWPGVAYPPEARLTFRSEYAVPFAPGVDLETDPDGNPAKRLVREVTGGRDPRDVVGQAGFAKLLTAAVIERVTPEAQGFVLSAGVGGEVSTSVFVDTWTRPLLPTAGWDAIRSGRGTELDLVYALVAVLREAGIPARLVAGVRVLNQETGDDDVFGVEQIITAWAEFYLMDERRPILDDAGDVIGYAGGWIPIDIIRQRNEFAPVPRLDQPWRYFGNHDEMHLYVPLAFHLVPPTTTAWFGPPAFYGFASFPTIPGCGTHGFAFDARQPARDLSGYRFTVGSPPSGAGR